MTREEEAWSDDEVEGVARKQRIPKGGLDPHTNAFDRRIEEIVAAKDAERAAATSKDCPAPVPAPAPTPAHTTTQSQANPNTNVANISRLREARTRVTHSQLPNRHGMCTRNGTLRHGIAMDSNIKTTKPAAVSKPKGNRKRKAARCSSK